MMKTLSSRLQFRFVYIATNHNSSSFVLSGKDPAVLLITRLNKPIVYIVVATSIFYIQSLCVCVWGGCRGVAAFSKTVHWGG